MSCLSPLYTNPALVSSCHTHKYIFLFCNLGSLVQSGIVTSACWIDCYVLWGFGFMTMKWVCGCKHFASIALLFHCPLTRVVVAVVNPCSHEPLLSRSVSLSGPGSPVFGVFSRSRYWVGCENRLVFSGFQFKIQKYESQFFCQNRFLATVIREGEPYPCDTVVSIPHLSGIITLE